MLQFQIKFRLRFFNLRRLILIFLCLRALIIHELEDISLLATLKFEYK